MRRAYGYTLLIVLLWGISLVTNKALLLSSRGGVRLTTLQVAFWGMVPGWVAMLAVLALRRRLGHLREISLRGWLVLVAMGLFGWAGYRVALNLAFLRLPLPDAIIINYLHPVFVVLLQGNAFGRVVGRMTRWERPTGKRHRPGWSRLLVGVALCLLGVALIATEGRVTRLGGITSTWGAVAGLFAALSWGIYSNLDRFIPARPGREPEALPDVHSFLAMTFGVAMLAAVVAATHQFGSVGGFAAALYLGPWGPGQVAAWVLITITGVAVYCASYTLWLSALELGARFGEAHKLPPITYLTPLVGVTLGWLVLHEPFGPAFWPGAALIAVGNAVNVWPSPRRA